MVLERDLVTSRLVNLRRLLSRLVVLVLLGKLT